MEVLARTAVLALALLFVGVSAEEDYILLIDSSENAISPHFDSEIRFTVNLAKKLFNNGNRLGLFTFAENTHNQFSLDQYNDLHQIVDAITYVWYSTGNGNVGQAIKEVLRKGFVSENGDRECTSNILIVLTHSAITDSSLTMELKEKLEDNAIRLFVLNMVGQTASPVFADLANNTDRVFSIADFTRLESSVTNLFTKINSDIPRTGCGILTQWQSWQSCSKTCNSGQRIRIRQCQRISDTDKDCNGELSEAEDCYVSACNEPLDGGWANWQTWGQCSKTCDTGTQSRVRECAAPIPRNGGKPCPGASNQAKNCAEWRCPVCRTKVCPPGSHRNSDCSLCVCSNVTLYGRLMDDTNRPVKNASIFLDSRRYKSLAITNDVGLFEASGICITNEAVTIEAVRHLPMHLVPLEVNQTHWVVNTSLVTAAAPMFTVQPHNKIRMVGQALTLCCLAVGKPSPMSYKWYKDGIEIENVGVNGTLMISAVTSDDAAAYKCSTETEAGVSLSEEADVQVKGGNVDTCGSPLTSLYELPYGCQRAGDTTKNSSVDIGTCGKAACVSNSLHDNGTCADWWTYHCCDVNDSEEIEIICDGFSYTVTRIRSCKCKPCILKTSISGRVNGVKNGTLLPMRLGTVIVNGEEVAITNMAGFFSFEVPKGTKRVVATFHDQYFKEFLDTTKIVRVSEGIDTNIAVKVVPKPVPVPFNPKVGTSFNLGDSNHPPAGSLSVAEDSLVDSDGNPFTGNAMASLHFMDPRNRENLETTNGEFVSEFENGEKNPLQTFGIFNLNVHDENGKGLKVNKPMTFKLDSSLFNVSLNDDGEPDLALWDYDINKGVWVETSKLRFENSSPTSRHLLQSSSNSFIGSFMPKDMPKLDLYGSHIVKQWTGEYTNCDHSVKLYRDATVRDVQPKAAACYVSVSLYEDLSLKSAYTKSDISVKVFTTERSGNAIGFSEAKMDPRYPGHFCVETFCDKFLYLRVERTSGERFFVGNHALPFLYPIMSTKNNEVKFESRDFGNSLKCFNTNQICEGPMYPFSAASHCTNAKYDDDSFQFKFAPFIRPPQKTYNPNDYNKKLSWYPVPQDKATFRSCFMKVGIKVAGNYDLRLLGISYLNKANNESFGLHNLGFEADIRENDNTVRAACMEFRCPGYIKDGGKEYFDLPTVVEARLSSSNQTLKCTMSQKRQDLQLTQITDTAKGVVGFSFRVEAGRNYGSAYGIFINDKSADDVEKFCNSGHDTGPTIDGLMNPLVNTAVEFNCM